MTETLGILVTTDRHAAHVLGLARAARAQGRRVLIFLTHRGVLLTRESTFTELAALAEIGLCRKSFEAHGLDRSSDGADLSPAAFANQSRHADLIERADRYICL